MKTIRAIKSDTGALVTNDREIANILNKHFATTGEKQPRSQGFSVRTRRDTRKPWSGPVKCLPKIWQYLTATRQGLARYSLMKYTSLRNK
jgi:hypothetical protein